LRRVAGRQENVAIAEVHGVELTHGDALNQLIHHGNIPRHEARAPVSEWVA
jgi:hypothetical protein